MEPKFDLGSILITPNAADNVDPDDLIVALDRHATGQWGEVSKDDWAKNDQAVANGSRLLSVHRGANRVRFWLITEADRSHTKVCLPTLNGRVDPLQIPGDRFQLATVRSHIPVSSTDRAVMNWRPNAYVIAGILDNTKPGRVTGMLRFYGVEHLVRLDLEGDFHRDIRGTKLTFENRAFPNLADAMQYMKDFATLHTGKAGDITAGLQPADYADYPYIEWYSKENGRVLLELAPHQIAVMGTPISSQDTRPLCRERQSKNMAEFLARLDFAPFRTWS